MEERRKSSTHSSIRHKVLSSWLYAPALLNLQKPFPVLAGKDGERAPNPA